MPKQRFAQSYENRPVRKALRQITAHPSMEGLQRLLEAAQSGGLTADATGSRPGTEPVVRTLVASDGQMVLPLFTSVAEVRKAVAQAAGKGQPVQAVTLPASDALALVRSHDCAGVQFNPASEALVVAREHIERALGDAEHTVAEPDGSADHSAHDEPAAEPAAAEPAPIEPADGEGYSCVLLDLDGTVVDSAPGITHGLARMFEALDMRVPGPTELLHYVGPPMLDALEEFAGMTRAQAHHALGVYRTVYDTEAATEAEPYEGMAQFVADVAAAGKPLALATSKPEYMARAVLEYLNLDQYFTVITGASVDEKLSAKADIVRLALERLTDQGVDVSRPIMVGDRIHDIEGAAESGFGAVMVEWGYGSPEESGQALAVAGSVDELRALVLG